MEKVLYCLTRNGEDATNGDLTTNSGLSKGNTEEADGHGGDDLGEVLRDEVAQAMRLAGAKDIRINVADSAVGPGKPMRILSSPSPADAVVSAWVDSANDPLRRRLDEVVASGPWSCAAYLVTESAPLPERPTLDDGGTGTWHRTDGIVQIAFLRRPKDLAHQEWLHRWLDDHTQVAIDTQGTFAYLQNVVTRVLGEAVTAWDAIVEECFPTAAMTDPGAFYAAEGDDDRLEANQSAMLHSVARFVDLETIEVIPMSRYTWL